MLQIDYKNVKFILKQIDLHKKVEKNIEIW